MSVLTILDRRSRLNPSVGLVGHLTSHAFSVPIEPEVGTVWTNQGQYVTSCTPYGCTCLVPEGHTLVGARSAYSPQKRDKYSVSGIATIFQ